MADAVDLEVEYSTAAVKDEIKTEVWITDKNVCEVKLESSIDIKDEVIQSHIHLPELKEDSYSNKQTKVHASGHGGNTTLPMQAGNQDYPCDACNYKSTNIKNLRRHKKRHTGEKPFICTTCRYKSNNRSQLEEHIKSHTREKHYACAICDYKSRFFHSVVRHMKQHNGEQQLQQLHLSCKACDYRSTLQSDLVEHMKCHAGQGHFRCAICDYKSTYKSKVVLHMRYRHKHETQLLSL